MNYKDLQKKKIGFISLGCDKNRVDLEKVIANFRQNGFEIAPVDQANVVVINTCSFIEDARKESIESILNTSLLKYVNVEKIIVTGCINNMNYTDLSSSLPEVDAWVKPENNADIIHVLASLYDVKDIPNMYQCDTDRFLSTPGHYAYLKIAEGCNNFCSYCTIPYIRGRFRSTPIEELMTEAEKLVNSGVTELILVAQDVTKYGEDLYGSLSLVKLIRQLSTIQNLQKIRLLYCYPDLITQELINEMAANPKVAKYIDIPLQHIDDVVLKAMNRRTNKAQICDIINRLRLAMPDIKIRTTFIIGFPGESEDSFNNLCDFVEKYKLDYVGFFKYSREEGTRAYNMPNQVPASVKSKRLKILSNIQYDIVSKKNASLIGQSLACVVDEIRDNYAICRPDNCPDVDNVVFVKANDKINVGHTYNVVITKTKKYDLIGEIK